ncbi:MAG: helix-turn-helix domain-containing protein [Desulfovibrio sp.]
MENAYKEIAPRLVGLRDALDLSVEDMSEKTGMSVEKIKEYESGECEIPVGFLLKVSQACEIDLTVLISGEESRLSSYALVKKGEGLSVDRRKDYDYRSLGYKFTGRKMEPFHITVPPKAAEDVTLTQHNGQEFIYMLEGRLEVTLNKQVQVLEPGDSLYFDSLTPHGMRALEDKEAVFLDVIL